eukprot:TRINITY_DN1223_c0_g1_i2.p1 TRINITY_DN1223_c0_g1~~TRINITY_DN1223_c0_g1_i2.p1  ORF type:complete len:661 (+),score=104.37 TRINITY_DN1223_c0_g1_i2:34-1983(+)
MEGRLSLSVPFPPFLSRSLPSTSFLLLLFSLTLCSVGASSQWALEFARTIDVEAFAENHGLHYEGTVGILEHVHLFSENQTRFKRQQGPQVFSEDLQTTFQGYQQKRGLSAPTIKWFDRQTNKKREKRKAFFGDPEYPKQWHLHSVQSAVHLGCEQVWEMGYKGKGVRIAIVDDGIATTHPDLRDNARLDSSYNFNENIPSPDPKYLRGSSGDWHGTASGGIAAARDDGRSCGVGVAPHAELAGIAILQNNVDVNDAVEAKALGYRSDKNFIFSNSWGPIRPGSSGHRNEAIGPLAYQTLLMAIKEGRGGLGSIYVWAAGNDGGARDNCNYDGYANLRYVVLIGAWQENGRPGKYSEPCAALLALAPGGAPGGKKMVTTDLEGSNGLSTSSDCTAFAGTSAACPAAAGVIALVLEANPSLGWLEVQYVLADSMKSKEYLKKKNTAGQPYDENYGWGRLNAPDAVQSALAWGSRKLIEFHFSYFHNETVPFDTAADSKEPFISSTITVPFSDQVQLHHVEVSVWTDQKAIADNTITITGPSGTVSTLATPHGDKLSKWNGWRFLSRFHHGETSEGDWELRISSKSGKGSNLVRWKLDLWGIDPSADPNNTPSPSPTLPTPPPPSSSPVVSPPPSISPPPPLLPRTLPHHP